MLYRISIILRCLPIYLYGQQGRDQRVCLGTDGMLPCKTTDRVTDRIIDFICSPSMLFNPITGLNSFFFISGSFVA